MKKKILVSIFLLIILILLPILFTNKVLQLKISCRFGNAQSCYDVGEIYKLGKDVKKDYKEANFYYSLACDKGLMLRCHYLGTLFYRGKIKNKSFFKHIELFKKACEDGIKKVAII